MRRRLRVVITLSGFGHVIHNIEEFGLTIAMIALTILPAVITVLLWAAARRPTRRFQRVAWTWATIVVLGAGSVLPLPFLPFEPAQTVSHDVAHVVYALLQVPLLAIAWPGWGRTSSEQASGAAI